MYALNYIYFISCKDTAEDESMKIDLKYTVFLNTVLSEDLYLVKNIKYRIERCMVHSLN
jgi:hypothetical protein